MGEMFVNPWLLGGLSLAASPIIIHLLNRRRFKVQPWAAMDFLLEAAVSNRRRLKLQDLLLLLLRILLILLLVFTVARPIVTGVGHWREDERVIVLDDSMSMEVFTPAGAVFEAAREGAVSQVQDAIAGSTPVSLRFGTRPGLVSSHVGAAPSRNASSNGNASSPESSNGLPSEALSSSGGENTRDAQLKQAGALLDQLRQATPSDLALRFGAAIDHLIEEAEHDRSPLFRRVVLISDFRAVDWISEADELTDTVQAALESLRQKDLVDRFGFQLVDVGRGDVDNTAVTNFELTSDYAMVGVPTRIAVEVSNLGSTARSRLEGEIEIAVPARDHSADESAAAPAFRPLYRVPLPPIESIAPGQSATVEVDYTFENAGQHLLRVTVDRDQLPRDDESFCVIHVRDNLQVVLFDGAPGADRFSGESGFLQAALTPRGTLKTGVSTTLRTGPIGSDSLADVDVAFILNRASLADEEWNALRSAVEEGMGLAFFLGDLIRAADYERGSKAPGAGERLFPVKIGAPVAPDERVALETTPDHPAFRAFEGVERSTLEQRLFARYFAIEPSSSARVIGRYLDAPGRGPGTPAIVESTLDRGRVVVFNTSADRDWSDWPTDPSYLVTLQEWVRYLTPRHEQVRNLTVGDPFSAAFTPGRVYEVTTPSGETIAVGPDVADDSTPSTRVAFSATHRAGFYQLSERDRSDNDAGSSFRASDIQAKSTWFSCRRATEESRLKPVGAERFRQLLESKGVRFSFGQQVESDAFRQEQEGELWRALAACAGGVLLLELLLAWWFGRQ